MSKSMLADFVHKGNPSQNAQVTEEEKQKANQLKFETGGFQNSLHTQLESSKEHLFDQNQGGASHTVDVASSTAMPKESLQNMPEEFDTGLTRREISANNSRPRRGSSNLRHYRRADEDAEGYASSNSQHELDDNAFAAAAAAAESHPDAIQDFERVIAKSRAGRHSRAELDRAQGGTTTPDSYPQTSDGQPTRQIPTPPHNQHVQASATQHRHHFSPPKVRHTDDRNYVVPNDRRGQSDHHDYVDMTSVAPHERRQAYDNNVDEHGARQMLDRAQEYHKAHARRNSSQPPPPSAWKNAPNTVLPHHNRPSTTTPTQTGTGPHLHKAYNTLGFPHSSASVRFDTEMQAHSPENDDSAFLPWGFDASLRHQLPALSHKRAHELEGLSFPQPPDNEENVDYDPDRLRKLDFETLTSEPFDHDPRNPRDPDATPLNLPKQLDRLLRSVNPAALDSVAQAEAFCATLTLEEWQDAGKWMSEEFAKIEGALKTKRGERREAAKKFEQEVARREKAVQAELGEVEDEMVEMRRSGGLVLESRTQRPSQGKRRR